MKFAMTTQRTFLSLRPALLCLMLLAAPSAWPLDVGAQAPELSLPGLRDAVSLSKLKGNVVYVDFWASWCGPCKQSFPFMNELRAKYRAHGFEVIAVNLDARRSDADSFLAEVPSQFTIAFDATGDSAKRFDVKGMPSSYLIGRDGKVFAMHKGFREQDRKELMAYIDQAIGIR